MPSSDRSTPYTARDKRATLPKSSAVPRRSPKLTAVGGGTSSVELSDGASMPISFPSPNDCRDRSRTCLGRRASQPLAERAGKGSGVGRRLAEEGARVVGAEHLVPKIPPGKSHE